MRLIDADELQESLAIMANKLNTDRLKLLLIPVFRVIENTAEYGMVFPVSEKTPDDEEEKLVILSSGRYSIARYYSFSLPEEKKPYGWGFDKNHRIDPEIEEVIAWMDLEKLTKEPEDVELKS